MRVGKRVCRTEACQGRTQNASLTFASGGGAAWMQFVDFGICFQATMGIDFGAGMPVFSGTISEYAKVNNHEGDWL
jgi:hypothetical protein